MDYTLLTYDRLINVLLKQNFEFLPLQLYLISKTSNSVIILRHDVDRAPENSVKMSELETHEGIKGTYYFRITPSSFDQNAIERIADQGHEIGYHYEEVDSAYRQFKSGNSKTKFIKEDLIDEAYNLFCSNLEKIRKIYPVKTICAHGSPLSPFDNRLIWSKYDYKELGISGESYFDINWEDFAYFTDTGRRWNGENVSVRDKINSKYNFNFKSTRDIINNSTLLPPHIMINIHPQRWNDNFIQWSRELIMQSCKNVIKKHFLVKEHFDSGRLISRYSSVSNKPAS